jgi:hypothetical protein
VYVSIKGNIEFKGEMDNERFVQLVDGLVRWMEDRGYTLDAVLKIENDDEVPDENQEGQE